MIGPGDLVVCVDNRGAEELRSGNIYTVRETINGLCAGCGALVGDGLLLFEIVTGQSQGCGYERGYRLSRFHPIRKPSLKLIYQALDEVPTEVWE